MTGKSTPKYRKQKTKNGARAFVELGGTRHYLGTYGSTESRAKYGRLIGEWEGNGRTLAPTKNGTIPIDLTVSELIAAYWQHAEGYYVKNGRQTDELLCLKAAFRPLRQMYGDTPAREFGPRRYKAVRDSWLDGKRSRKYVNSQMQRVKRLFKWGAENEIVPAAVFHGLQAVSGLRRGRSAARETRPVGPVPETHVKAVLPHVSRQVAAMIRLQELIGARPGEVVQMRGLDLDMTGDLWLYRPPQHKCEHFERERVIPIGRRGQEIIKPFLAADLTAHLFRPCDAENERNARRRQERETPCWPSHCKRRGARNPQRPPLDHYTTDSYRRAIERGCARAFPAPDGVTSDETKEWHRAHRWHPNQLRHSRATVIRKRYGLEAARVVLGHSTAATTEIYAEMDRGLAETVAREVG